ATAAPKGARGVDGISRMGGFRFGERREQRKAPAGDTRNLASSPGSGHRTGTFAFPQRLRVDHPTGGACTAGSGPHLGRTSRSGRRPPTGTVFCVSGGGGGCQRSWRGDPGGGGHLHSGAHDQSSEVPGGMGGRGRTSGG